jgi:molybdopterin synthase sulfur carrier subunit
MSPSARDAAPATPNRPEVQLLLFASARVAAGTARASFSGATVGEVLQAASSRYGAAFTQVLERAQIWVDGEPASPNDLLDGGEEVAVLPPVSGGSGLACP